MESTNIPYSFESEASKLVYRIRRDVTDIRTRFQLIRIADYIRKTEWDTKQAEQRAKTRAEANRKAKATREHNKDPFGFEATRKLMAEA